VDRPLAESAFLRRLDSWTGAQLVGRKGGDYAGIAIPYFGPGDRHVREYRFAALPADLIIARTSDQPLQVKENIALLMEALYEAVGLVVARWPVSGRTALSQGKWSNPAVLIFDLRHRQMDPLRKRPIDNKWWPADGKYFYFDKFLDNDAAIYRLRLSDRAIERGSV
jgi:hypothetical protein